MLIAEKVIARIAFGNIYAWKSPSRTSRERLFSSMPEIVRLQHVLGKGAVGVDPGTMG